MNTYDVPAGERVKNVHFTDDTLSVDLVDGRTIVVPIVFFVARAYYRRMHTRESKWNAVMRDHLTTTQQTEGHAAGSWDINDAHGGAAGRHYMTCLCTMTLEVYYRHLPLYKVPEDDATDNDGKESKADKKSPRSEKSKQK